MSERLLYVMDPMCSWCWGFSPVVEELARQAAQAGVRLDWVVGGLRQERAPLGEPARERIFAHWRAVSGETGQPFNFAGGLPEGLVYDTAPACRALVVARHLAPRRVGRLARLIQQAFYLEGRDVTHARVLLELAEAAGFSRCCFAEAFDSAEQRSATRADFAWVERLGIAGFPTLLAERNGMLALLTNGHQPLERLSPLLGRWLERAVHA
ncbi:DsbA family protein [Azotobacter beijerinckii]|uniref:DSBA-like thioredoxin domain-containing protein n=1 Tax=Azotobacter beijerinckii TaxID=170623 RepID=A0A1I4CZW4_9GAMM|nr:DsbA family protein [Azotobacter beijerinckii]SFB28418.1 putative protein-disulfide isomerase [Azotobacter beijerinckii]SFK86894.1 putative protein-disulfide isomerase [Azotobacter beijerinckii]